MALTLKEAKDSAIEYLELWGREEHYGDNDLKLQIKYKKQIKLVKKAKTIKEIQKITKLTITDLEDGIGSN